VGDLAGILLTHGHTDHFRAAGTLSHRHHIPVFSRPATLELIQKQCAKKSYRKLRSPEDIPAALGDIAIEAFSVPHGGEDRDAGDPVAFVLRGAGAAVTIATDLGSANGELRRAVRRSQAVIIESNYDEEMLEQKLRDPGFRADWDYLKWVKSDLGHLSNRQCAELLASEMTSATTNVFLAHLSENHHDPRRDNNSFDLALGTLLAHFQADGRQAPPIHRTYRRGLSNGQPSEVVEIGG
jgi:phosphoribosyl 1,2-cyclic phosphodiesterase